MIARMMVLLPILLLPTGCGQSGDDPAAVIQRGFQLTNEAARYALENPEDTAGRQRLVDEIVAMHVGGMGEGYVNTSPREGLWAASGFPDREFTIDAQNVDGDNDWTRYTVSGTHKRKW